MRHLRPVEKQWLFDPFTLAQTPSAADGIPTEQELSRRKVTIEYMRSLALRANSVVRPGDAEATHLRGAMTVGATLVHRFYMRRSFHDFPEKLIAPTVLFLATKIEEEPVKLRYIVNACVSKFEDRNARGWDYDRDPHDQPSREYKTWEKDILALEEIVLEAVCFDMGLEVPWVILRSAVKGLDEQVQMVESARLGSAEGQAEGSRANGNSSAHVNGVTNGDAKGKGREIVKESTVTELGWNILSESSLTPLSVIHPVQIIAFVSFALINSIVLQISPKAGLMAAAELGDKFGIDISFDDAERRPTGGDLGMINDCMTRFLGYIQDGLILDDLVRYIPQLHSHLSGTSEDSDRGVIRRRFTLSPQLPSEQKEERREGQAQGVNGGGGVGVGGNDADLNGQPTVLNRGQDQGRSHDGSEREGNGRDGSATAALAEPGMGEAIKVDPKDGET